MKSSILICLDLLIRAFFSLMISWCVLVTPHIIWKDIVIKDDLMDMTVLFASREKEASITVIYVTLTFNRENGGT